MCVTHEGYECFGVLEQQTRGVPEVYVMACKESLADAKEHAGGIWNYQGTVLLDKAVKFVICALDKCCECAFVRGATGGPCERCYCSVIDNCIGQECVASQNMNTCAAVYKCEM